MPVESGQPWIGRAGTDHGKGFIAIIPGTASHGKFANEVSTSRTTLPV